MRETETGRLTLITGATGDLGANLVHRLLDEGHTVRVVVRERGREAALEGLEVERVYGDLRDLSATDAAARWIKRAPSQAGSR